MSFPPASKWPPTAAVGPIEPFRNNALNRQPASGLQNRIRDQKPKSGRSDEL
jgi:hypothetical protein